MYDSNNEGSQRRSRSSNRSRSSGRKCRCKSTSRIYPVLVGILAVLIIVAVILIVKGCSGPSGSLEGRWDLDGATVYEFKADGKGALILTTMTFEFTYTVDGNNVSIDFADDRASDAKYEFVIDNDLLMLTGGPADSHGQHILKRDK